jgi:ribosomal protein S18 acetylase RimI-like enzyme
MNSRVHFRHYTEVDLDQVLVMCANEDWPAYTSDPIRSHSVFTAPGVVSVVAVTDDGVVGFAYCQTDGAIQAHLSLLVVDSRHRREGIARGLLAFAFEHLGANRMDLISASAEDFYRSLPHREKPGFRIYPGSE